MNMATNRQPLVIGVGELLWDLMPAGKQVGGAPANFAYHAHSLGAKALVVSRIGNDALGQEILEHFRRLGLRTDGLSTDPSAPTGTVSVDLDAQGVPTFTIHENVAWDLLMVDAEVLREVAQADVVCFGSLGQRNPVARAAIRSVLGAAPADALHIFDINLRQHFWSREIILESMLLADVLKLNDSELPVLAQQFDLQGDARQQMAALASRFDLKVVALTRGAQGSLLYQDERWSECRSRPVEVVDTVGAGDAFTAALAMGLLRKMDLDAINQSANEVARYVCSCAGATPPLPESLRKLFL